VRREQTTLPHVIAINGGVPIKAGNEVIAASACRLAGKDEECVNAGLEKVNSSCSRRSRHGPRDFIPAARYSFPCAAISERPRGGHLMSACLTRFVFAAACALAAPASAQTIARKDLSVDAAVIIATTAMADCKAKGWPVSVAVVGRNGELLVHLRGDGTGLTPWITATARPTPREPAARRRARWRSG